MSEIHFTPQPTPNPDAYQFVPSRPAPLSTTRTYTQSASSGDDSVASRLLSLDGVVQVTMSPAFCSVTKEASRSWDELIPAILGVLHADPAGPAA